MPLRSFGDPLKHPGHGLIGRWLRPEGSKVCDNDRFKTSLNVNGETKIYTEGNSAEICSAEGKKLYVDHVLQMQDAVFATRNGMPVPNLQALKNPTTTA